MKETLTRAWRRFCQDESGASAVEYGLLTALIAAVIVGTVSSLGTIIEKGFQTVLKAMGG